MHKHKVKQNKQNVITFVNQSGEPDCPFSALASEKLVYKFTIYNPGG